MAIVMHTAEGAVVGHAGSTLSETCKVCPTVAKYLGMLSKQAKKFQICPQAIQCMKDKLHDDLCNFCAGNEEVGKMMGRFTPRCMVSCIGETLAYWPKRSINA